MTNTVIKLPSYEDILDLPDNMIGEIINGRLEVQPRPTPKHALTSSALGVEIGTLFHGKSGGTDGWWILDEPELHIKEHILVSDLAGWRKQRMPKLPETAWFELAPDCNTAYLRKTSYILMASQAWSRGSVSKG